MRIDYKVAKQLKDAGFPAKEGEYYYGDHGQVYPQRFNRKQAMHFLTYIPTLSELIEACGDEEFSIQIFKHGTSIGFPYRKGKDDMPICKTPEEAVANLWLKLNTNYER